MVVLFAKNIKLTNSTNLMIGVEMLASESGIDFNATMKIKVLKNEKVEGLTLNGHFSIEHFFKIMKNVEKYGIDDPEELYVVRIDGEYFLRRLNHDVNILIEHAAIERFNRLRSMLNTYRSSYSENITELFFHVCVERHGINLLLHPDATINGEDEPFLKQLMMEIVFKAYDIYEAYVLPYDKKEEDI